MKIKLNEIEDIKTFVEVTRKFASDIDIRNGRYCVDAKSIMGLFSLDISKELDIYMVSKDGEVEDDLRHALQKANLCVA